jgi:hypothetical protein
MKKQAYTMIAMMILAGFVAMSSAKAQSVSSGTLVANIPFEFTVGKKAMPAGEYTVRNTAPASQNVVLLIQGKSNKASAMIHTTTIESRRPRETTILVFHGDGERYSFAQAWLQGDSNGLEAPRPRVERDRSDRLAGKAPKTRTVVLTARR